MSLRFVTAGESHGPGLTAIVEGLPAGLELAPEDIDADLARRQLGHGRGGRMKIEKDRAQVTAGVRHGRTLGSPVCMWIENRDYQNWEERMNPWPVDAEVDEVHLPRPGHADLAGIQKFGHTDVRERAGASVRARDGREGGRGRSGEGVPACARGGGALARHPHWRGCRARRRRARGERFRGGRRIPGPLARLRRQPGHGRRDRHRPEGERVPRRRVRGDRVRARARHRLARVLGAAPRRPAGPGDHVDPGAQGRGHRRRLRARRARGLEGPRRDLLVGRRRLQPRDEPRRRHRGRHDDRRPARRDRRDEAAAHAHQAAPTRWTPRRRSPRRRSASAPTPAPCRRPAWWGRRWWRWCSRTAYREKFGGDHMDDVRAALAAYRDRIGWRRA